MTSPRSFDRGCISLILGIEEKRFAQSADYFLLHLRSTVDSFHHGEGLKHALVATGKVDDHYHICPQSIQSQLNAMDKGHCGKIMRSYLIIWRNRLKR